MKYKGKIFLEELDQKYGGEIEEWKLKHQLNQATQKKQGKAKYNVFFIGFFQEFYSS